ncbi:MAG: Gfo/Idh/MocA family oxidoreductase [Candidatus Eisenbacteria bacterium]|uniref:Gfo/Idh/MocA family oxidoreductase n=1 Tax=Eiseniibacteriota bacterium TaxID=2212470 RepID=A0A948W7R6_UNCEI|nr:Gfo/Idh/MocA family oxidoreductase [Candidatus Eisenbacteria bacterium]MBU1948789.1 Gfo/Idh/MocA family oxidoreductase [Candidatus Eisenbacteria bacterium]MBU2692874.1 Gfo/Idh/MocA family oxidoreductase [Candidatus Eisenbacteria bacterium]
MGKKKIRWAIIGNGFARQTVLPCLSRIDGLAVVALCARHPMRAQQTAEEFNIPEIFTDYRLMISGTKPDLVMITTPPRLHREISLFALEQGCHVLCEKPTAMNAQEAREMWEAARNAPGRIHLIDHELRLDPSHQEIKRRIQEGWLGSLRQLSWTQRSEGMASPDRPWSWWNSREAGGGLLGALGSHAVDLFRHWAGEFSSVWGMLQTQTRQRHDPSTNLPRPVDSDDAFTAVLKMAEGSDENVRDATARFDMNSASPGPWMMRIEVIGTSGRLLLDDRGMLWGTRKAADGWEKIETKEDLPAEDLNVIPDTVWARAFLRSARLIQEGMKRSETKIAGLSTFEDGWRNQTVLDAIRLSSEAGTWIDLPPEEELPHLPAGQDLC